MRTNQNISPFELDLDLVTHDKAIEAEKINGKIDIALIWQKALLVAAFVVWKQKIA